MRITATDPITSLYGAFGKYLYENHIDICDVEQVMLTGVGSAYIEKTVYGLPTSKSDEFVADGLGARFESGLDRIIVVSMGTGTSLVRCVGDDIRHIGGISIGGGTLAGLSRIMLQTSDIRQVSEMAQHGNIANVNLMIGDISARPLPGLPMNVTLRQCTDRCRQGGYRRRTDTHRAADHRQRGCAIGTQYRHTGVCHDRKPHTAATVPRRLSHDGATLWRTLPYTEVFAVLHGHRSGTRLCLLISLTLWEAFWKKS